MCSNSSYGAKFTFRLILFRKLWISLSRQVIGKILLLLFFFLAKLPWEKWQSYLKRTPFKKKKWVVAVTSLVFPSKWTTFVSYIIRYTSGRGDYEVSYRNIYIYIYIYIYIEREREREIEKEIARERESKRWREWKI